MCILIAYSKEVAPNSLQVLVKIVSSSDKTRRNVQIWCVYDRTRQTDGSSTANRRYVGSKCMQPSRNQTKAKHPRLFLASDNSRPTNFRLLKTAQKQIASKSTQKKNANLHRKRSDENQNKLLRRGISCAA